MDDRTPEFGAPIDKNAADGTPATSGGSAGGTLAAIGCLIAIAPIPAAFLLSGDMIFGVFMTAPLGLVLMIIGLVVALANGAREEPQRGDVKAEHDSAQNDSAPTAPEGPTRSGESPTPSSEPLTRPYRPYANERVAISRIANLVLLGDALVVVSTIINLVVLHYWTNQLPKGFYDESAVDWSQFYLVMTVVPVLFALLTTPSAWKLRSRTTRVEARSVLIPLNRTLVWIGVVSIFAALWVVPDALMHDGAPLGILNVIAAITPVTCGVLGLCVAAIFLPRLLQVDPVPRDASENSTGDRPDFPNYNADK